MNAFTQWFSRHQIRYEFMSQELTGDEIKVFYNLARCATPRAQNSRDVVVYIIGRPQLLLVFVVVSARTYTRCGSSSFWFLRLF